MGGIPWAYQEVIVFSPSLPPSGRGGVSGVISVFLPVTHTVKDSMTLKKTPLAVKVRGYSDETD
jgi:hypothetical protein